MENHIFHAVNIVAFDLHSVPEPLGDASLLQDHCHFLVDPDLYRMRYEKGEPIRTKSCMIAPLSKRVFVNNHFWCFYSSIKHKIKQSQPDYWNLQTPFSCSLVDSDLKVVVDNPSFQAVARIHVFLSSLGWSTTVNLRLIGTIRAEQITDLIGRLRGNASAGDPNIFELNGKRMPLWSLFRSVQEKLFEEVYSQEYPPRETRVLDRYIVISPARFTGPVKFFKGKGNSTDEMTDQECASILGMLYGKHVDVASFLDDYRQKKFSVVEFHNYIKDFSLTEFDKGSFLFMQETAQVDSSRLHRPSRRLGCFTTNIGEMVRTIRTLHHFIGSKYVQKYASDAKIGPLFLGVKTDLADLSENYQHDFCKFMFAKFNSLHEDFSS